MSTYEFDGKLGVFSIKKTENATQLEARSTNPVVATQTELELIGESLTLEFKAIEELEPDELGDSFITAVDTSGTNIGKTSGNTNFSGTEEEYVAAINKEKTKKLSSIEGIINREWAVVEKAEDTLSLSFIIKNIIESYGTGFKATNIPKEWDEILFTHQKPLEQNESDFAFLADICTKRGYRMVRTNGGREFQFLPEAEGRKNLSNYRVAVHTYGADLYDLNFLEKELSDFPTFVVKGEYSVTMTTNGGFLPNVRQFVDDEGKSRIVIETTDIEDSFLNTDFEFLSEKLKEHYDNKKAGTLTKQEDDFFDKFTQGRATFAEIKENYYKIKSPEYNSNNKEEGYGIFRYEGWETSFTTHGNPWAHVGEWLTVEGASSNLYFPFQIKGLTHRFSHKWSTDFSMMR